MKRVVILAVGALAIAGAVAAALAARGPDPEARPSAAAVERRVMSPFCPGVLLADCQTRQSAELRGRITDAVASGWTNRQIDSWLVSNYGTDVLASPPVLAWTLPVLLLLAGGAAVLSAVRRWTARPPAGANPPLSEDDRARLSSELAQFAQDRNE